MTEQKKVEREGSGSAETSHIAADPAPARDGDLRLHASKRPFRAFFAAKMLNWLHVRLVRQLRMSAVGGMHFPKEGHQTRSTVRATCAMRGLTVCGPGWVRSPWITNFCMRRSRRWRRATLSGAGGRNDECRHLAQKNTKQVKNRGALKLYLAKGIDPHYGDLWRIEQQATGLVYGPRSGVSRNLGPAEWKPGKSAYKASKSLAA